MMLFLQLVGAIVIAMIIFAALLYVWARWKLKSWTDEISGKFNEALSGLKSMALGGGVPPLRVKLMRLEGHEWTNPERIDELTQSFEEAGFARIGDFDVDPAMMELRAFHHAQSRTYAALYEHPIAGIWYDLLCFTPGYQESYTWSTGQKAGLMDRRESHPLKVITDVTTPKKAFEKFLQERPDRPWASAESGDFASTFETMYAQDMDWTVQRGGPTDPEIRRICQADGQEFSEEAAEVIRESWAQQAALHYTELLEDNFLKEHPMPAREWEEIRERVFFIHAHTTPMEMHEQIESARDSSDEEGPEGEDEETDWEEAIQEIRRRMREASPQRVFENLVDEKRLTGRFEKRGSLTHPIPADVYVGPAWE